MDALGSPWAENQSDSLDVKYRRLMSTSLAMWRVLKSSTHQSDIELLREIEFERSQLPVLVNDSLLLECALCHRPLRMSARCCLYCGTKPH